MISNRRLLSLLLTVTTILANDSGIHAESKISYRYSREIDRPTAKQDEIIAVTLDSPIYAHTRGGFPDLRIFDDLMTEVPYQIQTSQETVEETIKQVNETEVVSLKPEGQKLEITIKLRKDSPSVNSLIIATPLMNYERKVKVEGSEDGVKWEPLVTDAILFDYSQFMDVSNKEIVLPTNTARFFRITIDDLTEETLSPFKELTKSFREGKEDARVEKTTIERRPFRIDRISVVSRIKRDRVEKPLLVPYPIAKFTAEEDKTNKQTIITVQAGSQPLTGLRLETSSRNFSRRAWVEVPATKDSPGIRNRVGETILTNISFRNQNEKQLTIHFPELREETLRFVIANEDNPPLRITGIEGEGVEKRLLFLAQPDRSFQLNYDASNSEPPRYETNAILTKLTTPPIRAKLGAVVEMSGPRAISPNWLNNWYFLGSAIALMVAVLVWSLLSAASKLKEMPKE